VALTLARRAVQQQSVHASRRANSTNDKHEHGGGVRQEHAEPGPGGNVWSGRCTVHRELPAFVGSHCAIARGQEAGGAPSTNVVVALLRNKPTKVRERYRQAEASGDYLALSSVVLFELWYGVARSSQVPENTERLRILLSGDLDLLDFDDEDARTAGQVRA